LNILFAGKSIRKGQGTVKEKNRAKGRGTKGGFLRKRDFAVSHFTNIGNKVKEEGLTSKIWTSNSLCLLFFP
jgi:hypothetical protein